MNVHAGENVYSIIQAPRGDATEAIVLVAAWKTINNEANLNGVALALTLARYFKRPWFNNPRDKGVEYADVPFSRVVPLVEGYHLPDHT